MLYLSKVPLPFIGFFTSAIFPLMLSLCSSVKCFALSSTSEHSNLNLTFTMNRLHSRSNNAFPFHSIHACPLHIIADHLFLKNIGHGEVNHTKKILLRLINETNRIFQMDFKNQTIQFILENMTINQNNQSQRHQTADTPMTIEEFLLEKSLVDFRNVCLGIVFTFRDFGNILGATFNKKVFYERGNSDGLSGKYYKTVNHHRVSLNTIVISFLANQKQLHQGEQLLALVHELGHSLGGIHESRFKCMPGRDKTSNSIMDPHTASENKADNTHYHFSESNVNRILSQVRKGQTCQCCNTFQRDGLEHAHNPHFDKCEQICCRLTSPNEGNLYIDKAALSKLAARLKDENLVSYLSLASMIEHLHLKEPSTYIPILFGFLFLLFFIFIICSLKDNYKADDTVKMRAFRHSKMLRAFSVGDYMTNVYREKIVNINKFYCQKIQEANQHMHLEYAEAIARLSTLFPHVPLPYLERVVKISANESVAVKILLTHGYPMKTFYESMMSLKKLMKTVTIRYKK